MCCWPAPTLQTHLAWQVRLNVAQCGLLALLAPATSAGSTINPGDGAGALLLRSFGWLGPACVCLDVMSEGLL